MRSKKYLHFVSFPPVGKGGGGNLFVNLFLWCLEVPMVYGGHRCCIFMPGLGYIFVGCAYQLIEPGYCLTFEMNREPGK